MRTAQYILAGMAFFVAALFGAYLIIFALSLAARAADLKIKHPAVAGQAPSPAHSEAGPNQMECAKLEDKRLPAVDLSKPWTIQKDSTCPSGFRWVLK